MHTARLKNVGGAAGFLFEFQLEDKNNIIEIAEKYF